MLTLRPQRVRLRPVCPRSFNRIEGPVMAHLHRLKAQSMVDRKGIRKRSYLSNKVFKATWSGFGLKRYSGHL